MMEHIPMRYPIFKYGNPILHTKVPNIDLNPANYDYITKVAECMLRTMKMSGNGMGLAATQVGIPFNIFVAIMGVGKKFRNDAVFINAEIVGSSESKISGDEGCLSIPGISEKISRFESIELTYINQKFEKVTEYFHDIDSIVIQHELDHNSGITIIDKIDSERQKSLKSKLRRISGGLVKTKYPMV